MAKVSKPYSEHHPCSEHNPWIFCLYSNIQPSFSRVLNFISLEPMRWWTYRQNWPFAKKKPEGGRWRKRLLGRGVPSTSTLSASLTSKLCFSSSFSQSWGKSNLSTVQENMYAEMKNRTMWHGVMSTTRWISLLVKVGKFVSCAPYGQALIISEKRIEWPISFKEYDFISVLEIDISEVSEERLSMHLFKSALNSHFISWLCSLDILPTCFLRYCGWEEHVWISSSL